MPRKTKGSPLSLDKTRLWLSHFLDASNKSTFLQRSASAIAAGYKPGHSAYTMGEKNYKKFTIEIEQWLNEVGLSETALKSKLLSLMDATETRFFANNGIVTDERVVPAIETQRKTLDMAIKIRGMYAPEKQEHTGANGGAIQITNCPPPTDTIEEWLRAKARIDEEYAKRLGASNRPTIESGPVPG